MNLTTVWNPGVKELRGLLRDPVMPVLTVCSFSRSIRPPSDAVPEALINAALSIVDEDRLQLSSRITASFYAPCFARPRRITNSEMGSRMDAGPDIFALNIPLVFGRDLLAGRRPALQLNIDATRMSQAFTGDPLYPADRDGGSGGICRGPPRRYRAAGVACAAGAL